jgi:chitodextrinase
VLGSLAVTAAVLDSAPAAAAAPTTADLVGYWRFDEASGTSALDSSGRGYTGTLSGAGVTRVPGKVGSGALSFDGSSGKVTIPGTSGLNLASSFTLTAWIKPASLSSYRTPLVKGSTSACAYWLQTTGTSVSVGFGTSANCASYKEHVARTNLQSNVWYHVAARFDDSQNRITVFVNGNAVYSAAEYGAPLANGESLVLGQSTYAGDNYERWKGLLDEVRVYNRALSAMEIADIFADGGGAADVQAPKAPTSVAATPLSSTAIDVQWTASTDDVAVVGYRIYRDGVVVGSTAGSSYSDTGLQPATTYAYLVAAFDAAGNLSPQSSPAATATTAGSAASGDAFAPTVAVTSPASGSIVRGAAVTVGASASDNVGVVGVRFLIDGSSVGVEDTAAPFSIAWDTSSFADGAHQITARARDAAGNVATSAGVSVRIDNVAPTGTISINGGAGYTNSATVSLSLTATDAGSSVARMRFANGGGSFSSAEPYAAMKSWTLSSGGGAKTVGVQFADASGNWSPTFSDTITLDAAAPTIGSIAASQVTSTTAAITWSTDEPATSRVDYGATTSYGQSSPLDSRFVSAHAVTLTGLTPGKTYDFRVRSTDAAGNEATSANRQFVTPGQDVTPPTVPTNVAARALSATQIEISWTASTDDVGPISYRVARNGTVVGNVTTTLFQDGGLTALTTYGYKVQAVDGAGRTSSYSSIASATTLPAAAESAYPLRLSDNGRYVIDQQARPFFMSGDAAWSLIAQLANPDADAYLGDRAAKGYNAALVSLIEHRFASYAPADIYGDAPFTGATFSTPNEAYFAHADWIIGKAAEKGIVVLLAPLYLGGACNSEGWCSEVRASSTATMRAWGRYVGNRYKSFPNVVWVIGGDTDPVQEGIASKIREFVAGIRDYDTVHLITAHNALGESAMDVWATDSWLTLNDIYTQDVTYPDALAEYNRASFKPFFLIEAFYENEHGMTTVGLRTQAYQAVLSGATVGHVFGNCPIWNFGISAGFCSSTNWQAQLDSPGSVTLAYVGRLFRSRAFHTLVPDQAHAVLTSGYQSGTSYAAAARTADGRTFIAYLPTRRTVTIDLTKIAGSVARAWWYNAATAESNLVGDFATTGPRSFTPPTTSDWVLVIDDQSLGLPAPGTP